MEIDHPCTPLYKVEMEGLATWTEISAAESLAGYRAKQAVGDDRKTSRMSLVFQDTRGLSFSTISAFGSNGAIIHYSATPETDKVITTQGLLMVDSGGQVRTSRNTMSSSTCTISTWTEQRTSPGPSTTASRQRRWWKGGKKQILHTAPKC